MTNTMTPWPARALRISLRRKDQCFLCKWISEDLTANGKLTDYPKDFNGYGIFPIEGKEKHLTLEIGSIDNLIV
jgi:hypothetical protein